MQALTVARVAAVPRAPRVHRGSAVVTATAAPQEARSRHASFLAAGAAALAISLSAGPALAKAQDYGVYFIGGC